MAIKTYRGKCPNCCPDGGACFERWGDTEKKCNNCGHVMKFRRIKATGKISPSQQRVIDRILGLGWKVEKQEFIGRKLWIDFLHPTKDWMIGNRTYGTIGINGSFKLKIERPFVPEKTLIDNIDIDVYLR